MILNTGSVYRYEFGQGLKTVAKKEMNMSPRDASYVIATRYLIRARMLNCSKRWRKTDLVHEKITSEKCVDFKRRRDRWTIIDEAVQVANLNPSLTNQPTL